jgi:hypothetical protein
MATSQNRLFLVTMFTYLFEGFGVFVQFLTKCIFVLDIMHMKMLEINKHNLQLINNLNAYMVVGTPFSPRLDGL